MNAIDAAQANHLADIFWAENNARDYNEKIMTAISLAAQSGRRSIHWRSILNRNTQMWLLTLGYTITTITCDFKLKLFDFLISWEK